MTEQVAHIDWLGWIVFTIVVGSMFLVVLASILGPRPHKPKVTLTFIGTLLGLLGAVVGGIWIGGLLFSLFVP